jgi:hypothetical protein
MYQNGETAKIEAYQLDELIAQKRIKKFKRSGGWCTIGVHPTRKTVRVGYQRPRERGKSEK